MNSQKALSALLLAVAVAIISLSCAVPEPLPTHTPYPTWTPAPTAINHPTYTPLPTHTPYPTHTPLPTHTPYPTHTPLPTHTPYPTHTPLPATATPRSTLVRRPTLTPRTAWESTGDWQRDRVFEQFLEETLRSEREGLTDFRAATLDATPDSFVSDLYVTFVCLEDTSLVYLTPYTYEVIEDITAYAFAAWNITNKDLEKGFFDTDPMLTDDGISIYITHPVRIRQLLDLLFYVSAFPPSKKLVSVALVQGENIGLGSHFNPTGIADVLQYLGCFD